MKRKESVLTLLSYIRVSLEPPFEQSSLGFIANPVAMSTVNGLAGLQTNTITPNHITGKRKRVESVDDPQSGGVEHINPQESDKNPPGIQQLLVDILAVSKMSVTPRYRSP